MKDADAPAVPFEKASAERQRLPVKPHATLVHIGV